MTATETEPTEATDDANAREHAEGLDATDGLFDRKQYDGPLALPEVDGQSIDRIALKFSGTVFLDRSDEADVALIKAMSLGNDMTLMIEGKCAKYQGGFVTNKDGDLDAIVLSRAITVHTVYRPTVD